MLCLTALSNVAFSDINTLDKQKILSIIQNAKNNKNFSKYQADETDSVLAFGTLEGDKDFAKHLSKEYPSAKYVKKKGLVYPLGILPMLPSSEKTILPEEKKRYSALFGDETVKKKTYSNKRGKMYKSGRTAHVASKQSSIIKKFY